MRNLPRILAIIIIILVVFFGISAFRNRNMPRVDKNGYQAVFIEGSQIYFGHLKNADSRNPYMTDIYYVKAQNPSAAPGEDQQFQLIKFGNEIHGPEDVLFLNSSKILFWENLRPDSKVVKGIEQEKVQRAAALGGQGLPIAAPIDASAQVVPAGTLPPVAPAPVTQPKKAPLKAGATVR